MKKLLFLLLPLFCAAAEYEFLTPRVLVIKSEKAGSKACWAKENALLRDKKANILRKADITYYSFHTFDRPFAPGEKRTIGSCTVQYNPETPSHIFKLNQLGGSANQKKKFAYMGAWLGSAGPLPLKHLEGKEFELRRVSDGKCVYKNRIKSRPADPLYQGQIPFTGEEVMELDYSAFKTPGKYFFYVESVGRSMEFTLGAEPLNEAFYIHARGLYHKRCGIAKKQPFTAWEAPLCHQKVFKGRFPENSADYLLKKGKVSHGFTDRKGNYIAVRHFDLIKQSVLPLSHARAYSAPGGWHDAADYDRRPQHLRIVSDLATVYLMKPQNFTDGQLNLPESGNNIPDILDEAAWGLKHLLAVQQKNGGVGTWFETTGHPGPGEGLPHEEKRTYYVSAPSRNGTLQFAAAAGTLALAMQKAGAEKEKELYLKAAVKGWNFACDRKNQLVSWFMFNNKMISYMENHQLDSENLVKAAAALYLLTGEKHYLEALEKEAERQIRDFRKDSWKWSALSWMILELFPEPPWEKLRAEYRKAILRNADEMLGNQENAYPYRTLWHARNGGWVHAMSWGTYHPLRRAMTLIAAHRMTGDEKYLTGAFLANDFHNGANPLGRSMTSGLGKVYPVVFLDLVSYNGKFREFVPGITPYGNTFGIDRNAVKMVYKEQAEKLPVFRRYVNLEFLSVPASEYSVWETIAPAAVVSGYLIESPALPAASLKNRKPAADFRKLPGYRALP